MRYKTSTPIAADAAKSSDTATTRSPACGLIRAIGRFRRRILGPNKVEQVPIGMAHLIPEKPVERRIVFGSHVFIITPRDP